MNAILWFHDAWFLWFVQKVFYAFSPLSTLVMIVLQIGLPERRSWLASLVAWSAAAWALLCLVFYGALVEAPVLGWTMAGCLSYRLGRDSLWLAPSALSGTMSEPVRVLWWLRPRATLATWLIQSYLRADPRCVYWLDLARAVRGLPIRRSETDRRALLIATPDLPARARWIWWRLIFPAADLRIALFTRLPRWWHRRHQGLALGEDQVRVLLEAETDRTFQEMFRAFAGRDFDEYRSRSPETHQAEQSKAGAYGSQHCALKRALAEYLVFREPWQVGEPELVFAANLCYRTWQVRRQYDELWHTETDPAAAQSLAKSHRGGAEATSEAANPVSVPVKRDDENPPRKATESLAESSGRAGDTEAEIVPQDESEGASDEELFEEIAKAEAKTKPAAGQIRDDLGALSPAERDRQADLQEACRMLEAYLGVTFESDFDRDARRVERLLDRPNTRTAALMLLLFHCLRGGGNRAEHAKGALAQRLLKRFASPASAGESQAQDRRLFAMVYVDLLMVRGEYANIRALFDGRDELNAHELKVLGDATALLAGQLAEGNPYRDLLRFEAIGFFFRAGFMGLWTPKYVRMLIGPVPDARAVVDLLARHPVEIGRVAAFEVTAGKTSKAQSEALATQIQNWIAEGERSPRKRSSRRR
jgi:hypothetical protein